ncbi:MAG: TrkA family potassium uptake protein [Muribaculaceae bacterium]|nr:TrkA family potassium uptake protein [Muribaculaceae bacterium]
MKYLIIGLGIFGDNLARDLTDMGHEVIGADICQSNIDDIKDYISTVYLIDSTEESALDVLPLRNVDVVVVAIGENFGASIRTVALLKKAGVKHIYARATDSIHEAILEGFHIDRVLTPEQRAAADLTHEMQLGPGMTTMKVDDERLVVRVAAPEYFIGMTYGSFNLPKDYDLTLVGASRPSEHDNVLGITHRTLRPVNIDDADEKCLAGDVITIFGTRKAISDLYRHIL